MKIKIIKSEEVIKNPVKFMLKNFQLVEEDEKLFLRYDIDKQKELRIFFKKTLLDRESKEHIKKCWENEQDAEKLLDSLWIVKSQKTGVLLLVPEESEKSDKTGVFVFIISKLFSYPNPLYFKRSYLNSNSIGLYKLTHKKMAFLLGSDTLNMISNIDDEVIMRKFKEVLE